MRRRASDAAQAKAAAERELEDARGWARREREARIAAEKALSREVSLKERAIADCRREREAKEAAIRDARRSKQVLTRQVEELTGDVEELTRQVREHEQRGHRAHAALSDFFAGRD